MPWEAWSTLALLVLMLVALARQSASPAAVLVATVMAMLTLGLASDRLPDSGEMAASFGNEGLLTIGALFVVAAGLTRTGSLQSFGGTLLGRPKSVAGAQLRLAGPVALFSAFLNNTPVVAMLIPVVQDWCRRVGISASKLLIPLSYLSVLGGTCTLIGTSTNLVVQGQLIARSATDPDVEPMGLFTLTPIGIAVTLAGLGLIVLGSRWLLPDRGEVADSRESFRQFTVAMTVTPGGLADGRTVADAGLRSLPSLFLIELRRERDGQPGEREVLPAVGPDQVLRGGDELIFAGAVESVAELQSVRGLSHPIRDGDAAGGNGGGGGGGGGGGSRRLVEAVVSHTSSLIGVTIRDARFRTVHRAAVVAVRRHGERLGGRLGDITLRPGDGLLLEASPDAARALGESDDFYVAAGVADLSPPDERKVRRALLILAGLVVAMIAASLPWPGVIGAMAGRVSILYLALLAAGAMLAAGCLTMQQARRSIDWSVLIVIGAALFVARCVEASGLAGAAAEGLLSVFRPLGPWGMLAGVYLLTLLLTELITNNAAAALAFPFAYAAAKAVGADVMPFALATAVAASCGFATPLAYQTHLMVLGPGRYRFGDFARIGLPMDLVCAAVSLIVIPLLFPLSPQG